MTATSGQRLLRLLRTHRLVELVVFLVVVFSGGNTGAGSNIIDYITIAAPGNASDFGDLSVIRSYLSSCSSSTRGVVGSGYIGSPLTYYNVIDYVTISATGNAVDFGDLSANKFATAALSNGHGGL
jgi:hypothetical protein